jgi:hypothetical protein
MIIIGSRAAQSFINSFREPNKDWDVIGSQEEIYNFLNRNREKIIYSYPSSPTKIQVKFIDGTKIEFELDSIPSNKIIINDIEKNWFMKVTINLYGEIFKVCQPMFLMLMKRALLDWPVHWEKSINDYHIIRKYLNPLDYNSDRDRIERGFPNFLSESEKKFYNLRCKENIEKFGEKKVSLDMTEEVFFGRSKKIRIIDHDILHRLVMFYEEPLYEELKIEKNKPILSEEKFRNSFSFDDRIKLAQEECLAIAFERFYLPKLLEKSSPDILECYKKGIQIVASRLTKGWFCDFIIDHYDYILDISESHIFKSNERLLKYIESKEQTI